MFPLLRSLSLYIHTAGAKEIIGSLKTLPHLTQLSLVGGGNTKPFNDGLETHDQIMKAAVGELTNQLKKLVVSSTHVTNEGMAWVFHTCPNLVEFVDRCSTLDIEQLVADLELVLDERHSNNEISTLANDQFQLIIYMNQDRKKSGDIITSKHPYVKTIWRHNEISWLYALEDKSF